MTLWVTALTVPSAPIVIFNVTGGTSSTSFFPSPSKSICGVCCAISRDTTWSAFGPSWVSSGSFFSGTSATMLERHVARSVRDHIPAVLTSTPPLVAGPSATATFPSSLIPSSLSLTLLPLLHVLAEILSSHFKSRGPKTCFRSSCFKQAPRQYSKILLLQNHKSVVTVWHTSLNNLLRLVTNNLYRRLGSIRQPFPISHPQRYFDYTPSSQHQLPSCQW